VLKLEILLVALRDPCPLSANHARLPKHAESVRNYDGQQQQEKPKRNVLVRLLKF
jgi:hypothetical protein